MLETWDEICLIAAQSDFDYAALVQLLQDVADNGASAFYSGDVADDIVATVCALVAISICILWSVLLYE